MGHPAQRDEYRFVEQGADDEPLGGDDRVGLRDDAGDLDLGDGLECSGIRVEDFVGRREVQFLERVEGGCEGSPVGTLGGELPAMTREQLVDLFDGSRRGFPCQGRRKGPLGRAASLVIGPGGIYGVDDTSHLIKRHSGRIRQGSDEAEPAQVALVVARPGGALGRARG